MADPLLTAAVAEFLFREAELLDRQRWRDWLALYCDDAVFWVPAYTDRGELVSDPETQLNLIYITSKRGLEERVFRMETGESAASNPAPRTCHLIANVLADGGRPGECAATANWQVASYSNDRGPLLRNGRYEYVLRGAPGAFRIARKKIVMLEEKMEGFIDFYAV